MEKKSEIPTWEEIRQIFEEVALRFKDTDRKFEESRAEFDRGLKESRAEFDRGLKESRAEYDRRSKDLDRKFEESRAEFDRGLKESRADYDRRSKDIDRKFEESRAEFDRRSRALDRKFEETDRLINNVNKEIGGVSLNIGHHAEQYFKDSLEKDMTFGGVKYDKIHPNLKKEGKKGSAEFDIVLENGKSVAIIEAKNRIHPDFLDELVNKKVAAFRKFFPKYANYALYLGVAGFSFDEEVIRRAKERGVGVLKQVGKSVVAEPIELKAY